MKTWLWHQIDAFAITVARFARTPGGSLLNVGVIGVALALPVGLYVAVVNLQGLTRSLASDPQLSVFLALDAEWARRLEAGLRAALLAVWLLATLFAFALVAVTFNTIRLQILTRREEIEVSKLIGATDSFIRRPFLYFGALQGLAGGLAAWAIIWVGVQLLNGALADLSRLYAAQVELQHLSLEDTGSLLAFSAILGWFGSWLSVNRHLARIEPR